jgi:hypothetical protein
MPNAVYLDLWYPITLICLSRSRPPGSRASGCVLGCVSDQGPVRPPYYAARRRSVSRPREYSMMVESSLASWTPSSSQGVRCPRNRVKPTRANRTFLKGLCRGERGNVGKRVRTLPRDAARRGSRLSQRAAARRPPARYRVAVATPMQLRGKPGISVACEPRYRGPTPPRPDGGAGDTG